MCLSPNALTALGAEADESGGASGGARSAGAARRIGVCRAADRGRRLRLSTSLPWPEPAAWLAAVRASTLAGEPPVLRLYDDRLLYLDRYWREEQQVCD